MENRNTFIALALMLLVWVAFTIMFPTPQPPQGTPPATTVSTPKPAEKQETTTPAVSSFAPAQTAMPASQADLRDITIESDLYRAVVSSNGGRLKEFQLKRYKQQATEDSPLVNLVTASDGGTVRVSGEADITVPRDARFFIDETRSTVRLNGTEPYALKCTLPLPSGLVLVKEYSFVASRYAFDVVITIQNPTGQSKQGRYLLELTEATELLKEGGSSDFAGAVTYVGTKLHSDKTEAFDKGDKEYAGFTWSAFKNKYFLRSIVPLDAASAKLVIHKSGTQVEHRFFSPQLIIQPGEAVSGRYLAYFGPAEIETLKAVGHDLDQAVDLGWFSILARPFFGVMAFFYGLVGNYGWAIIILTVIIKLLFWPLTNKSYASMKAMQKLQPEMQRIREKYKNDRDRMNLEIMNLYKDNRVNPLGGCLPMLVQMPIFFALYQVLMNMTELRHAPFIFWITDLSAKDPYYITPLVMGATMFIQQKLTPSQLDPIQQKIFLIMPVVFTFLFLTFPSGLVIYWLVNNLLTILQQLIINRKPD